ncbi:MAG: TIGR02530 family flagellar biosynthesis protein [Halanaerobiales bacterium]|nr:TIGR02530 family flagellar biosynthesis protein [Halanaerobiales bacterium]
MNTDINDKQVNFSRHARNRITSREINISNKEMIQLKAGIDKAVEKGAKNSLIVINKTAYIVSVESKTVVTIIDRESIKEKVFTNIDSAVLM